MKTRTARSLAIRLLTLAAVAAIGVVASGLTFFPDVLAQKACPPGSSLATIVLGNGQTRAMCLPDAALSGTGNAPPGTTPVVEVGKCQCDFSPRAVEQYYWDLRNTKCANVSTARGEIAFSLNDFLNGLGNTQLAVTGGTHIKGNRCTAESRGYLFQENSRMTDGEVIACVKDLSAAADHFNVLNECKL